MFKYILSLIFPSESKKIRKQIKKKYEKAIWYQRNGNIRGYSALMSQIVDLEERLVEIEK